MKSRYLIVKIAEKESIKFWVIDETEKILAVVGTRRSAKGIIRKLEQGYPVDPPKQGVAT